MHRALQNMQIAYIIYATSKTLEVLQMREQQALTTNQVAVLDIIRCLHEYEEEGFYTFEEHSCNSEITPIE